MNETNIKNEEEIWKPVINYEDRYIISNYGKIKSIDRIGKTGIFLKGKELKIQKSAYGYSLIPLSKNGITISYTVGRLVAQHFVHNDNPNEKIEANHIDGNKRNNYYKNLEWISHLENMRHARRIGLKDDRGEKSWSAKTTEQDVINIRQNFVQHKTRLTDLANKYNLSTSTISDILKNKTWKHINIKAIYAPKKTNKMNNIQKIKIKELYYKNRFSFNRIANEFNVSITQIRNIIKNVTSNPISN